MSEVNQVERLSTLIDGAAAVVGEVDLDRVLRRLVAEAKSTTGANYAALGVLGSHGVLAEFIYEGLPSAVAQQIGSLPQGRGVLGTVVRERRTIVLDNIADHPDSFGFPEHHPQMGSFLGVPIVAGEQAFGNLYLTDKPAGFDSTDIGLVEALATIAGSAISTARLRDQLEQLAIVQDRDRIARDLHDSIIQDLFAIGLSLQSLSERVPDESAALVLADSVDRLDETVESLRSYIYDLKSTSATRPNLQEQLQATVDRFQSAYPNKVELTSKSIGEVDPATSEQVVLLASEALSNALRHSGLGDVTVEVSADDDGLNLIVQDRGRGFIIDEATTGMGLINMRDRVRRLQGEIEVKTKPGQGTVVVITLPTN
jgi:signal transduction histidine kinase